jgi:hypothetical protein
MSTVEPTGVAASAAAFCRRSAISWSCAYTQSTEAIYEPASGACQRFLRFDIARSNVETESGACPRHGSNDGCCHSISVGCQVRKIELHGVPQMPLTPHSVGAGRCHVDFGQRLEGQVKLTLISHHRPSRRAACGRLYHVVELREANPGVDRCLNPTQAAARLRLARTSLLQRAWHGCRLCFSFTINANSSGQNGNGYCLIEIN